MRLLPLLTLIPALLLPIPALAQSIIPAADGTGTLVLPDGTTYTITGGTLSGDGANLFHSFEQFGLTAAEVATFLADPAVQNILGRVVGGNASLIDGLMQVNGDANLYLINPAGILFGPNTVLNVDGSFTATSASGVGFGEAWLHALEQSNYSTLTGDPTAFSFAGDAGAIINSGNLAVGTGERLTLMGGSVVNLGTLEAPGGQIMVLAVPGENLVILRPVGALLGLELAPLPNGSPALNGLSPLDIPGLLRAGEPEIATGLVANPDGTVSLVGSTTALPTTAGTAIASGTLSTVGTQGGTVQVLGDRVAVVQATVDASGIQDGGQVLIGGEYQGRGTTPTANRTFVDADTTITANGGTAGDETGDGGEVILWAEEATRFDGTITAQGGVAAGDGGFVEVSGRETLAFNGLVDVRAPNGELGTLLLDPTNIVIALTAPSSPGVDASLPDILAAELPGDIVINSAILQNQSANVVLQATNNITVAPGVSLTFVPGEPITFTADADNDGIGNFAMDPAQSIIAQGDATTNGRDITISGAKVTVGDIRTDVVFDGTLPNASSGGNITITATNGGIDTGLLDTSICDGAACTGNAGNVTLTATNPAPDFLNGIRTGVINTSGAAGTGGDVSLVVDSPDGDILTGDITTLAGTQAGNVTVEGGGGLLEIDGFINASAESGTGGAVRLVNPGPITVEGLVSANSVEADVQLPESSLQFNDDIIVTDFITLSSEGDVFTNALITTTGDVIITGGTDGVVGIGNITAGGDVAATVGDNGQLLLFNNLLAGGQVTLTTGVGGFVAAESIEAGTGITIITDDLGLGSEGPGSLASPGELVIQPASPDLPMVLGGFVFEPTLAGLYLNDFDLESLADGFSSITFGSATGTGAILLNADVIFRDPTVLTTLGTIDTQGFSLRGTDNASLVLEAGSGVAVAEVGTENTFITLVGDRDGDGEGRVSLDGPITTNGGAITVEGAATEGPGIALSETGSLNSGGGGIILNGSSTLSPGIELDGTVTSGGGNLAITGTSTGTGPDAIGVEIANTVESGGGTIALTGSGLTAGIAVQPGGSVDAGTSSIDILTNNPLLTGPVLGGSVLTIRPVDLALPFTLGGVGDPTQAFLNQAEIDQLGNGFTQRIIGQSGNTGAITLDSFILSTPLAVNGANIVGPNQNTTWATQPDGSVVVDGFGAPLQLLNPTTITGGTAINTVLGTAGNDTITPTAANTLQLGTVQFRNVSIFDGLTGIDTVQGTTGNDTVNEVGTGAIQFSGIRFNNIEDFDGGAGINTVIGSGLTNTVASRGANAIDVNGVQFSTISFFDGTAGTYTVLGTTGDDTVSVPSPGALQVNDVQFIDIAAFNGQGGVNTLLGTPGDDVVVTTGPNALAFNGLGFINVSAFEGGGGINTVLGSSSGSGTVSLLNVPNALALNNTAFRSVSIFNGGVGTYTLLGTAGDDQFNLLAGANALQLGGLTFRNLVALDGGGGFNTLVGTPGNDSFVLLSPNGGFIMIGGALPGFSNINAINTLTGEDALSLVGVPLDIPVESGGNLFVTDSFLGRSAGLNITLNADLTVSGNLTMLPIGGPITQTGGRIVAGGTTRLQTDGMITLLGDNDFNVVTMTGGQSLELVDINDLVLGEMFFTEGIAITAAGNLTATRNLIQGATPPPLFPTLSILSSSLSTDSGLITVAPTGVMLTSGEALTTADITVPGGPITLVAGGPLTTGNLDTSGATGGAVSLMSGDRIQVNTINAQGESTGGSITATSASTFQALGSFVDQNGVAASLSTVGGSQGGPITLTYTTSLFTIGDATINGTQGAITSGDITLVPGDFVFGSRVFGSGLPGQVAFIAPGETPPPPPRDDVNEVRVDDTEVILADDDDVGNRAEQPVLLTNTGRPLQESEFSDIEADIASEFSSYFGGTFRAPRPVSLAAAQNTLREIQAQTGEVPALVYVRFNRQAARVAGLGALELLVVPPDGDPIRVQVLSANPQAVMQAQELLRRQLTNPNLTDNTAYLAPAQQLYDWIIAPIRNDLEAAGITNLSFVMDAGLRTLPLAALHDGEQFLIENYSVGLVPSLGLIDPTYVNLNRQSATMTLGGASQFLNQPPLLAARTELDAIQAFWPSSTLAENNFTVAALQQTRQQAQIVHLATHAQFSRGAPDQSYIQFFDERLYLDNMAALRWFDPTVDLVTLSACQTAMGNLQAELGFAGFALQAGARSALASLWRVSDEATAGLMTTFYQQLDQQTTKSEALRQAQLAFVRGEAIIENGQIRWPGGTLPLPPNLVVSGSQELNHPFYWAAFTVVGSPW